MKVTNVDRFLQKRQLLCEMNISKLVFFTIIGWRISKNAQRSRCCCKICRAPIRAGGTGGMASVNFSQRVAATRQFQDIHARTLQFSTFIRNSTSYSPNVHPSVEIHGGGPEYVSTLFIEGVADPRKYMSLYAHRHSFSIKNYVYNTLFITNFCDIKPICFAYFLSFDCVHIQLTMGVTDSRVLTSFFISINAPITTRIIQTIKLSNTEPRANTGP